MYNIYFGEGKGGEREEGMGWRREGGGGKEEGRRRERAEGRTGG